MTLADRKSHSQSKQFLFRQLMPGLTICESIEKNNDDRFTDVYHWGNATAKQPPFLVYLGYNLPQERDDYISQLRHIWQIDTDLTYRAAQRVTGYWYEIKIRGMRRYSDPAVFDLDYLSEGKAYGLDFLVHLVRSRLAETEYEEMMTSRSITYC
jgi:hypothetical protein